MNFDLKARRETLGLTQAQLADHLGIAPNTIARWERGEREPEGGNMLDLALRYLELSQSRGGQITKLTGRIGRRAQAITETTQKISARRKIA